MSERRMFLRRMGRDAVDGVCRLIKVRTQLRDEVDGVIGALTGERTEADTYDRDFFDSYEMSYSMTLAYPRDFFEQMAEQAGVEHDGVETLELVKALHQKGVI